MGIKDNPIYIYAIVITNVRRSLTNYALAITSCDYILLRLLKVAVNHAVNILKFSLILQIVSPNHFQITVKQILPNY